jgi:16S rRNA (cytosine967-C5)-methyltransferase
LLFWIECFSRRPLAQLDPKVVLILELGIYQLVFTGIAQHAAIYETVNLCKRVKLSSAASFVNGVLRAVQSGLPSLPKPENADRFQTLSIEWSHPHWLAERWCNRFGEQEAVSLMKSNNEPAPVCLRINPLRATREVVLEHLEAEGVRVTPTTFGDELFQVTEGAAQLTKSFVDGEFYIQDAGIEKLGEIINPRPGMQVLEIAAAPGGKTFQLAVRMQQKGMILCLDSVLKRMRLWQRNISRLGIVSAHPVVADARHPAFHCVFDLVVVDAPCSSLGVVRRHPEVKWWRNPVDLLSFQELQLQMLSSCAKYVREQGELVYTVCSFEPEETIGVSEIFLASHSDFERIMDRFFYPHRDQTDGFFIGRFRRHS